jgi:Protein of unknown function (DUF998)
MLDSPSTSALTASHYSKPLLMLGAMAGPLYILVGLAQMLVREGFDMRRHALSLLSNGELGWIQIANFLLSGVLVIAGALGCRLALRSQPAGLWGPILLGIYGIGLIGAGIFPADPGRGFPPGVEATAGLSNSGLLHFVFGGIGFYALIAACFVFARRFVRQGLTSLAWYSIVTGLGFFASFAAIASGSTASIVMIEFYIAVAWIWVWHTIMLLQVARRPTLESTR